MTKLLYVFGVRDVKSSTFSPPFTAQSTPAAMRMFGDAVKSGDSLMSRHPGDFGLYLLGEMDEDSGVLSCGQQPQYVCMGADLLTPTEPILPFPQPKDVPDDAA